MFHLSSLEKMMPQKALGDISQKLQEILPESTAPILENLEDEGNGNFNSNLEEEIPPPANDEIPPVEEEETPPPENEGIPSVEEDESPLQEKKQTQSSKEMDTEIKQENGESEDSEEGITPDRGPENDGELQIVTDLHNKEITYDELENDVLNFYAYLLNGEGKTLKVKLQNSLTPQNGNYLVGSEKDYQAVLGRNEVNLITLYVKDGKEIIQEVTYAISYVAKKADEKNPTVGEKPPTIITNLENVKQLNNRNFTLNVQAIAYTGNTLYSSNIEVRLDGKRISNPTGGPRYEYQLYFEDPEEGDVVNHTVTVRAWDDEGNSAFVSYHFDYHLVDTGGEIGTAYIILDATTVGLGIIEEPYCYTVKQNVPASYAVMEMLDAYGYDYSYAGSADVGFYLQRIQQPGLMDWPDIPENLWDKIVQDDLNLTGQKFSDSLGEFDYTQGAGWMYSVGGKVYAGKGLSNYFLNNGDTLYLRFTLAYGKDIGGYASTGGEFGKLSTYCGKWINDGYVDQHHWEAEEISKEPTCTSDGEKSSKCSVCGDLKNVEIIPALGHEFQQVEKKEPAVGENGYVLYRCVRCDEEKREDIPCLEEETPEPPNQEEPEPPNQEENGEEEVPVPPDQEQGETEPEEEGSEEPQC